jgi:hypothetical protein
MTRIVDAYDMMMNNDWGPKFQVGDVIRSGDVQRGELFLVTGVRKSDRNQGVYSYVCRRIFRMFANVNNQHEFTVTGTGMQKVQLLDIANVYSRLVNVINEHFRDKGDE